MINAKSSVKSPSVRRSCYFSSDAISKKSPCRESVDKLLGRALTDSEGALVTMRNLIGNRTCSSAMVWEVLKVVGAQAML